MPALYNDPLANVNNPATIQRLWDLHPSPPRPLSPLSEGRLPPPPCITEAAVEHAVRGVPRDTTAGPERTPSRWFHLLIKTCVSPEAGVTGLRVLTELVSRLARGELPDTVLPLLAAATLLPLQPTPDKVRLIAIRSLLRRIVTKALLPAAMADSHSVMSPHQMANGEKAGLDSILHETLTTIRRFYASANVATVLTDSDNAFNRVNRQSMLDHLPMLAPSLAHFANMIYGRMQPPLLVRTGTTP